MGPVGYFFYFNAQLMLVTANYFCEMANHYSQQFIDSDFATISIKNGINNKIVAFYKNPCAPESNLTQPSKNFRSF